MLSDGGHAALIVGGAVRNGLIGAPVEDVDIATDALPARVQELAQAAGLRAVPTGIDHGTITVVTGGRGFEVTTFRRDVETDGRRAVVAFSDRVEEDAARRDFTMNALYATAGGEVIDPVGGLPDLTARQVRFVGNPAARIAEDYLRVLRFFRFHAWYGAPGAADPEALAACAEGAPGMARLSRERIGAETRKLLAAPDPSEAVALMAGAGVLAQVLPGADPATLPALIAAERGAGVAPDWLRRLASLHGDDPAEALRLSRAEAARLARLAPVPGRFSVDAAGYRLGESAGRDAALLAQARGEPLPEDWPQRLAEAAASPLPISAADLSPPLQGPAIGQGLRAAEQAWIDSGFAMPAPGLIDVALTVAETGK
ncbi:CCA tRNA nucleotidyltransferase [Paracoccus sp. S-4012]|nr:CCA tRNA nucleotidyltransferase [Paracoccus sp. S-4012]MRX49287.1 CCA tRNA nucleotidyltransferase [Paracoccus sp. S-4012]